MAAGHDLLALYGTWRLHVNPEDQSVVDSIDKLIQRSQDLGDLYVRWSDREKGSQKPSDAQVADDLLQALTWTWIHARNALASVAADLIAAGITEGEWDF